MKLFDSTPREAGLYWCMHKDTKINGRLHQVMGRTSCFEVRTEGFDGVMDEFLHVVNFEMPRWEKAVQTQRQDIVKMVSESASMHKDQYLGQAEKQVAGDPYLSAILEGDRARYQGDYVTAIGAFRRALELRRDDPTVLNDLGVVLSESGHFEESIEVARRSLELLPDQPIFLNTLGFALRGLGQLDEAIKMCQRALELRPDHLNTLNTLGVALRLAEKSHDAQGVFERVVSLPGDKDDLNTQMNRMIALIGVGRLAVGIASCKALIAKGPAIQGYLWQALGDLKPLAQLGVDGAQECVSLIETALAQEPS